MNVTLDSIKNAYKTLGYPFKDFNILGIRAKEYNTNTFNDLIGFATNDTFMLFEATTDPGHIVGKDHLREGTATMKAGFYPRLYRNGFHKNNSKHPALVQVNRAYFYRVKNGKQFDHTTLEHSLIGANLHSTRIDWTPTDVDNFSLACQVIRRWQSHLRLMVMCRNSGMKFFDYALFQEKEICI